MHTSPNCVQINIGLIFYKSNTYGFKASSQNFFKHNVKTCLYPFFTEILFQIFPASKTNSKTNQKHINPQFNNKKSLQKSQTIRNNWTRTVRWTAQTKAIGIGDLLVGTQVSSRLNHRLQKRKSGRAEGQAATRCRTALAATTRVKTFAAKRQRVQQTFARSQLLLFRGPFCQQTGVNKATPLKKEKKPWPGAGSNPGAFALHYKRAKGNFKIPHIWISVCSLSLGAPRTSWFLIPLQTLNFVYISPTLGVYSLFFILVFFTKDHKWPDVLRFIDLWRLPRHV